MKLTTIIAVLMAFSAGSTGYAAAAENSKINVSVDATSSDVVGQQFVYELREALGSSSHLASAATEDEPFFQLKIVTLDPYSNLPGSAQSATVYSVVLTGQAFNGGQSKYFLDQWVGTCGGNFVHQCAARILASADAEMTPIIESIRKSVQKPRS